MTLFNEGTIYINPAHLVSTDPSTFVNVSYLGEGERLTFDRRVGEWADTDVYLFNAMFSDGLAAEVRVNTEFGSQETAMQQAEYYAEAAGRTATGLRSGLQTITIHEGNFSYGGGSNDLLIHTGLTPTFLELGSLDEAMVHEMVHITLDTNSMSPPAYIEAQVADGTFPSPYAQEFPGREDQAEAFLLYYVLRKFPDRLTAEDRDTIVENMANRIEYFDSLQLDLGILDDTPGGEGTSKIFDLSAALSSTALAFLVDFDGNSLGATESWTEIGRSDVQGDGDIEVFMINEVLGRWATLGITDDGRVDFGNNSTGGDTRVVGIYEDPLVASGQAVANGPFDSQTRFANDIATGNLGSVLGSGDFDKDGFQEVYFGLEDGSAVLHAYMHADGNIQYANYQSAADLSTFMIDQGIASSIWDAWI